MVETPKGFPEGYHTIDQIIVGARVESFDRESRRAKLALELQFPHTREHPAGPASTTLAIEIEALAARDLWISLSNLGVSMNWPPVGVQTQVKQ
jgi:hypothetical protein